MAIRHRRLWTKPFAPSSPTASLTISSHEKFASSTLYLVPLRERFFVVSCERSSPNCARFPGQNTCNLSNSASVILLYFPCHITAEIVIPSYHLLQRHHATTSQRN